MSSVDLLKEYFHLDFIQEDSCICLNISADNLLKDIEWLKEEAGFIFLLDICGVDNLNRSDKPRFQLVYHLLNMETHERLRIYSTYEEGSLQPSLCALWKGAKWYEREAWDLFGISFEGKSEDRLLTYKGFEGHPLRKDFNLKSKAPMATRGDLPETKVEVIPEEGYLSKNWIEIDPTHPGLHGSMRILLELEGDKISDSLCEVGFLHRGVEKMAEGSSYTQIMTLTDRLNYNSAPINTIGWCKAIEDFQGLNIPEKAMALRMVFTELSRISDHLHCLSTTFVDAGYNQEQWKCLTLRDLILSLFEDYCGSRITPMLSRIGGLPFELPVGWSTRCLSVAKELSRGILEIDSSVKRSHLWMERSRVCAISAGDALDWGFSGPCLRACGVNYDIRKASPYYFYSEVDFEIPLGINGDGYDRFLVRIEECHQSLRIIQQVLDNLPSGEIISAQSPFRDMKEKLKTLGKEERLEFLRNFHQMPKGEYYSSTEASNGELGFFFISEGEQSPYRLKVRAPSFSLAQSYGDLVKGSYFEDAFITLSSLNLVPGEIDR